MRILQSGMPKSGNLWLYRILQLCAAEAGWESRSFIRDHPIQRIAKSWELSFPDQAAIDVVDFTNGQAYCRISSRFRERIRDFDNYLSQISHVWTHSQLTAADLSFMARFDRIVYIVRDPRDIAISMSRFVGTPYMQTHYPGPTCSPQRYLDKYLVRIARSWTQHVGAYLLNRQAMRIAFVFYERLLDDFDRELAGLLEFLDIDAGLAARTRIKTAVQFENMRSDHPQHLRTGRHGVWREMLSAEQQAAVARHAGAMLQLLGYPLAQDAVETRQLPGLPDQTDQMAVSVSDLIAPMSLSEQIRNRFGELRRKLQRAAVR